ncbi:MAG: M48 family metallopeptidase [Oceanidesulfovibrio sp.]
MNKLPHYRVRENPRARRIILKVIPRVGLTVTVPKGYDHSQLPKLLNTRKVWIDKALRDMEARGKGPQSPSLPEVVELAAVNRTVAVAYEAAQSRPGWREEGDTVVIAAADSSVYDQLVLIEDWLKVQGRRYLVSWCMELAAQFGVYPKKYQVRLQKSRWGSCSIKGTLSLNAKLLLIPRPAARYVLIHELCHIVHPNHSARYWKLLQKWEPEARALDRYIDSCWRDLPAWLP